MPRAKRRKHRQPGEKTRWLYFVLRALVVLVMVRQIWLGNWSNVFTCVLTLVLFLVPSFAERRLNLDLPELLEAIVLIFIFSAEILGEIGEFYVNVRGWDTLLHTVNGFLAAAVGFALIDLLNRHPRFHFDLSPIFVAFVAFCFSMTIGVLWEFFEYAADSFLLKDMQKDTVVTAISSVALHPEGRNIPVVIDGITETVIRTAGEEITVHGGYLDVGLRDTMKDLLVNFIGAAAFSVGGYFYIKGRARFPERFIPRMLTPEELETMDAEKRRRVALLRRAKALRRERRRQTRAARRK